MRRNGEIIIIEDDEDDRLFLQEIFESLDYPNKVVFFEDPSEVLPYLADPAVKPFIIFSDVNMPKLNGYELREKILADANVSGKCVPYIFLSTSSNPEYVQKAFAAAAHGYFQKESQFPVYKEMIQGIVEYWRTSLTPSSSC